MSKLLIATRRVEHLDANGKPSITLFGGVLSNLSEGTYNLLRNNGAGRDLTEAELALYEKLNPAPAKPTTEDTASTDSDDTSKDDEGSSTDPDDTSKDDEGSSASEGNASGADAASTRGKGRGKGREAVV